jgi:hypothetical protein
VFLKYVLLSHQATANKISRDIYFSAYLRVKLKIVFVPEIKEKRNNCFNLYSCAHNIAFNIYTICYEKVSSSYDPGKLPPKLN